jgi:FKBP-type peptidyl-prolyl cis-trans isomerase FklB
MTRLLTCIAMLFFSFALQAQETVPKKAAPEMKTTREQASYAIGLNIGRNFKKEGLELNSDALVKGLLDAMTGAKPKFTEEQCRAALEALDREMQQVMADKNKLMSEKNKKEGQAYLTANKAKQGVVTLPSGLQYSVLKAGKGPTPTEKDVVRAHYHGTLIDGKVFDSSVERGEPLVIPVGQVIRGWTEALQKMKVGDKWRLVIPSELAYGAQNFPPEIGPNAVLIFDIELLGIEPKQ